MLRAMVFIDYENFNISYYNYHKLLNASASGYTVPRLNYKTFPQKLVRHISDNAVLVKTYLFAPKPDSFLMTDPARKSKYDWLSGLNSFDYFTVVEGSHIARPTNHSVAMDINNKSTYYVQDKGTDVNLAITALNIGFHNGYDMAIIVGGDTDYIPVADILCGIGKTVVFVGVKNQNLSRFEQHSDAQILLDKSFFSNCYIS